MRVARQASRTRVRPAGKRRLYAALCAKASPLLPKAEANAFPSLRDAARTERSAFAERLVEKGEDRAGSPKHRLRCTHKSFRVAPQTFNPPNPSRKAKLFHSLKGSKKTCVVNESTCVVNESTCVVKQKTCVANESTCVVKQKTCVYTVAKASGNSGPPLGIRGRETKRSFGGVG